MRHFFTVIGLVVVCQMILSVHCEKDQQQNNNVIDTEKEALREEIKQLKQMVENYIIDKQADDNESGLEENDESDGSDENDEDKRGAYLRFGKRAAPAYLRFGKRMASYIRFGKRSENMDTRGAYLRFGKRAAPAYLRFGRSRMRFE